MADGGQGFLKVCFSVLPDDYQNVEMEGISHPGSSKQSRSSYIEGGTAAKKGNLTGVN